ncbi:hypothetical protein C8Z91_01260 [Paenibacillus elgii]|uniref:ATPase dynein-related AAA domain-containing protein n=2 Tax=Paenibacillus elgii TaxID=189691 RepID=A0A2T6GA64_9BACL|nr:hypothetical protein C8Z91_01260 [Paenibacillus elgii]
MPFEDKKHVMKGLRQKYENKLNDYNKTASEFASTFLNRYELEDHIITARIGSPTPYGNQLKDYLWSGISLDKDKSFSFQYSWVFQKEGLEVTFCFGSGGSSSGSIEEGKKLEKENRMRAVEQQFLYTLSNSANYKIVEQMLNEENFVLTSEWLNSEGQGFSNINEYLDHIRIKTGAKTGITRYFKKDELLADKFNLEEKIYCFFDIFRPIWDQLHKSSETFNSLIETSSEEIAVSSEAKTDEDNVNPDVVNEELQKIRRYIRFKGFQFPDHLIENFYLSLKTKPFVILAGVSGTGKTKLVKLFAEALGATSVNRQFTLIPVRPDWSDPSDLLGYKDLSGAFRPGRLTEVLLEATKPSNRHKPYFICLDEMNLARVEHYFSDLLSVLETQEWRDGRIVTASLIWKESLTTDHDQQTFGNMYLPDNVYLVGTVNMDETTHPFSKKVLDRANTIEFNYINLAQYPDEALADDDELAMQVPNGFLRSDYLQLVDTYGEYRELVHRTTEKLVKINTILEEIHSHVGFRIRDAICFYLIYNERFQLLSEDAALDMQLLQKILPRVQGSGSSVKRALLQLMEVALDKSLPIQKMMDDPTEPSFKWNAGSSSESVKYPQSARKIAFMLRRLEEDGFTSYWLS